MTGILHYGCNDYFTEKVIEDLEYTTNAEISAWQITFSDTGMPILAVPGERLEIGYLTPFRAYRFQVSGTIDGTGDYGSSDVATNMYELAHMGELGCICLRALALEATNKFGTKIGIKNMAIFDAFIELSADYLRKHTDHIKQCYHIA